MQAIALYELLFLFRVHVLVVHVARVVPDTIGQPSQSAQRLGKADEQSRTSRQTS